MNTPTSPQVISTVEAAGSFLTQFFPAAAPGVVIADNLVPLIAPGALAIYQALFAAAPAGVTDESWLALLQGASLSKTLDAYIKEAQAALVKPVSPA
jgi:hypothetical protein